MNQGSLVPKVLFGCTLVGLGCTFLVRNLSQKKNQRIKTSSITLGKRVPVEAREAKLSKTVHFVRHAEAVHNEAYNLTQDKDCYKDPRFFDAELTGKGREQCTKAKNTWSKRENPKEFELLVVSPLQRCLQTATEIFGQYKTCVPWIALEEIRERAGHHPCDKRRPLSVAKKEFPHVDFSQVCDEEDMYWGDGEWRETNDEMYPRIWRFLEWLAARPEKNIVVVTHSAFLSTTFNEVLDATPVLERWFENCEIRSVTLNFDQEHIAAPES
mmetsp:Transcript_23506/g.30732  ORF Transcript_23506/g.30732 Transcript_23506/m.30732 type:complete len:270 (+) Transcript_23506:114-923(+)